MLLRPVGFVDILHGVETGQGGQSLFFAQVLVVVFICPARRLRERAVDMDGLGAEVPVNQRGGRAGVGDVKLARARLIASRVVAEENIADAGCVFVAGIVSEVEVVAAGGGFIARGIPEEGVVIAFRIRPAGTVPEESVVFTCRVFVTGRHPFEGVALTGGIGVSGLIAAEGVVAGRRVGIAGSIP